MKAGLHTALVHLWQMYMAYGLHSPPLLMDEGQEHINKVEPDFWISHTTLFLAGFTRFGDLDGFEDVLARVAVFWSLVADGRIDLATMRPAYEGVVSRKRARDGAVAEDALDQVVGGDTFESARVVMRLLGVC